MSTTPKRKRGQHAKRHPWSNRRMKLKPLRIVDKGQLAWIEFTTSDEYRAQLTCTHTAFMAGYRAGKDAK